METHIVIAGGTGFIGEFLTNRFRQQGYQVSIISRQHSSVSWNNKEEVVELIDGCDVLINLAGKSVNCRYNDANRKEIFNSRIGTTRQLGEAILQCKMPPKLWINSSTATIYRHATDRPMTEQNGEIGSGFSVDVATGWELAFFDFKLKNTRQVALRTAIVLGANGGVMKPLSTLVRSGLGGRQGSGKQKFSWLHEEDLFQIILFLWKNERLTGVFNCSSPKPVDNLTLMKSIRKLMGISLGLPSPEWLLKIGALLIGTETELVLKSRWVLPERLVEAGYKFKFPDLNLALAHILKRMNNKAKLR